MRLEDVYQAKLKDMTDVPLQGYMDDSVLVYKRFNGTYKELRSGEVFEDDELTSMISLSKIVGITGDVSKNSIIQMYYSDKHRRLNFNNLYIADVGVVGLVEDIYGSKKTGVISIYKKRLLYKEKERYIDLESYEKYGTEEKIIMNQVLFRYQFLDELREQSSEEKGKVLKLYYSKYRGKEVS